MECSNPGVSCSIDPKYTNFNTVYKKPDKRSPWSLGYRSYKQLVTETVYEVPLRADHWSRKTLSVTILYENYSRIVMPDRYEDGALGSLGNRPFNPDHNMSIYDTSTEEWIISTFDKN